MNKVMLVGRLTRDPQISNADDEKRISAWFTLAVDRRFAKRDDPNAQTADFISCIAFGGTAGFANRYVRQGMRMAVYGRLSTGSYTNKDGQRVYTTDVIVEEMEFAQSKDEGGSAPAQTTTTTPAPAKTESLFTSIPDDINEELPFN